MADAIQRATQGFAAVAVAATLVTVGATVYERRAPDPAADAVGSGTQSLPRPFDPAAPPAPGPTPSPSPSPAADSSRTVTATGVTLPATVYRAYVEAESRVGRSQPACGLRWPMLAGIGQVESGQARDGALTASGDTVRPILGPALDGDGFGAVADTDEGRFDGDTRWDRAVGPMQFIPGTWAVWGTDGNDDGTASPHNMYDAALSAGRYLCAAHPDLSDRKQLRSAILTYNRSGSYADTVLAWIDYFSGTPAPETGPGPGVTSSTGPSPSGSGSEPPPSPSPSPSGSDDVPAASGSSSDPAADPSRSSGTSSPPPGGPTGAGDENDEDG
ncbi:lytic transglycosylase domain-containing protein [Streptomyces sp. NPDC001046]|uniref:lytic transglycosylase domain-containing protein n=1 Tax=Streptomyces sp. NPDC001046 TaxID=3364543 RepID=UPI0036A8FDA5